MELITQVALDLMAAMKGKEKEKLEALRALKTAFTVAKSNNAGQEVSNEEALKIVQRLVKQRKESATEYIAQNRQDLAEIEINEVEILSQYLPKQLSEGEITEIIKSIISTNGYEGMKDMGKVMGELKQYGTTIDGKIASNIVKQNLQ